MINTNKKKLLETLLSTLTASLNTATKAANTAKELATHEQSKPETQYDTVGLEASYLAHGQSQRVAELTTAITDWQSLAALEVSSSDPISAGMLVQLTDEDDNQQLLLLGNYGGGIKLKQNNISITVITTSSPIGKAIINKHIDDEFIHPVRTQEYWQISDIK